MRITSGEIATIFPAAFTSPLTISTPGRAAHASVPARADNPVRTAAKAVGRLLATPAETVEAPALDAALDALRSTGGEGRRAIAALEARYRASTGIAALKIRHNNVLGYFIEVTAAHADKLLKPPLSESFIRRARESPRRDGVDAALALADRSRAPQQQQYRRRPQLHRPSRDAQGGAD